MPEHPYPFPTGWHQPLPQELTLYLVRHGETELNARHIVQGSGLNPPLNETGHRQARLLYQRLRHIPFERIYVTSLERTRQTLAEFTKDGHRLLTLDDLKEIHWGDWEGMQGTDEVRASFRQLLANWADGNFEASTPGGETLIQAASRIKRGLETIFWENPTGNVLVCTHGRTLRIALALLSGYGLRNMERFEHANTGVNIVRVVDKHLEVLTLNSIDHLSPVLGNPV
jgi:probable phosphoglycerate mutase